MNGNIFEVYRTNSRTKSLLNTNDGYDDLNTLIHVETGYIKEHGLDVKVRGSNTKELLGLTLKLTYKDFNMAEFLADYFTYYSKLNLDPLIYLADKDKEYSYLYKTASDYINAFKDDLSTRRNIFLSDKKTWCITNIHWLTRAKKLYTFVDIRSSDFEKVLYTDMYVILILCEMIRKRFKLKELELIININSAHVYV